MVPKYIRVSLAVLGKGLQDDVPETPVRIRKSREEQLP